MAIAQDQRFEGSAGYVASHDLIDAVNIAIDLEKPLIIRGEPGTGKTQLARSVAESLGMPLFTWHVKSTTKAKDGLYFYDTVQRLNDARFHDRDISDIRRYIRVGKLGEAFRSERRAVLLIDEIDKADIEFPNDLLNELDEMAFHIPETNETVTARHRPVVIITSNSEKDLPDAFLRRCVFHYIEFPGPGLMRQIVDVHFPGLAGELLDRALELFYMVRKVEDLRKKPSTSELLDWIKVLVATGADASRIARETLPYPGVLLKKEQDIAHLRRAWQIAPPA